MTLSWLIFQLAAGHCTLAGNKSPALRLKKSPPSLASDWEQRPSQPSRIVDLVLNPWKREAGEDWVSPGCHFRPTNRLACEWNARICHGFSRWSEAVSLLCPTWPAAGMPWSTFLEIAAVSFSDDAGGTSTLTWFCGLWSNSRVGRMWARKTARYHHPGKRVRGEAPHTTIGVMANKLAISDKSNWNFMHGWPAVVTDV